jgi:hypothetical protein
MALLNMNNVPGKIISGVDDETLNFITKESNERFLIELDPKFLEEVDISLFEMDNNENILTEEEQRELARIEQASVPISTQKETECHVKRFRSFLANRKLSVEFESVPKNILNDYLCLFYSKLRKPTVPCMHHSHLFVSAPLFIVISAAPAKPILSKIQVSKEATEFSKQ